MYYPSEDLHLNIARGLVKGTSFVHKFGAVPTMSTGTRGTVWDVNDTLYPWQTIDSGPTTVYVSGVGAGDAGKLLTIEGLDENYELASEEIALDEIATITTTTVFSRVYRAYITSGFTLVSTIVIQRTGDNTTIAAVLGGNSQTLMAVYTVPAGYKGYLTKGVTSCQANADATIDMFVRYGGTSAFRIGHTAEVAGVGGQYNYDFTVPLELPALTDIDIQADVRSNNARVTAAFDIILIKDNLG